MNNTKTTKRALLSSVMAMLICVAMLIGTTFAWFTDKVTSNGNIIQSGKLDISATFQNTAADGTVSYTVPGFTRTTGGEIKFSSATTDINENNKIIDEQLWEPGAVGAKLITVNNDGNLAAKIMLNFNVNDGGLQNALWYDFIKVNGSNVVGRFTEREMSTLSAVAGAIELPLMPKDQTGDSVSFILVYGMKEEAGNEYQEKSFSADVTILATQYTKEKDSFDKQYDKDALYPVVITNNTEAQSSIITGTNSGTAAGDPIVNVITSNDITLDLDANGGFYNATLGGTDSETVTIDANGNKITFDSNYRNAINCYGKLTISNAELDSTYKTEGSTWDDYALIFRYHENGANEVVFNNVTFDRQVAIEKGVKATFNNCTINQTAATGDMYALWICAGADVTLNGCTINSINSNTGSKNRAIKIADEYVAAPTLTKLSVAGTTFKSHKKAAVLVTSTAGANIVWGAGNDISAVEADSINAVWNDADRTAAWDLVTVSGCTKIQES